MSLAVHEDQVMLADSARKYVERGYTPVVRGTSLATPHGCATGRWRELANMGWLALPLPEADGGLGGSVADLCVLGEEFGRALVVEPWNSCAVMAPALLARCGSDAQRAYWMPLLANGEKRLAFAVWEPGSRFAAGPPGTRARRVDGGYRLSGAKELVAGAPGADALIVYASCDTAQGGSEPALFLLEPETAGLAMQPYPMVDGRHAAQLQLDGVVVAAQARLDAGTAVAQAVDEAIDRAIVVSCAEAAGAMAKALEITLDYLKTRKQFGRILASNQVLQHRLVDLYVAIEETRALVGHAARTFDGPEAQRSARVAAAKAYTAQAARLVWEEAIQMHGAIGMTDEYQLGQYAKFLAASHTFFGDAEQHLERLATVEDQLHAPN